MLPAATLFKRDTCEIFDIWKSFVVKPGGVATRTPIADGMVSVVAGLGALVLGQNWTVWNEELGAFMVYLVINGEGEEPLIENARIARRGRELLKSQKR